MIEGLSAKYEDRTRQHYGANQDMLKLVPVATDKNIAHVIAEGVNRSLDRITEVELREDVDRGLLRAKFDRIGREETDPHLIRDAAINDRLTRIVVNAEIQHATLALEDFNEDARKAGPNPMPPVEY